MELLDLRKITSDHQFPGGWENLQEALLLGGEGHVFLQIFPLDQSVDW